MKIKPGIDREIRLMEPKEAEAESIGQKTETSSRPSNSHWRDIFIVLLISWAARLAFVCMMPAGARSFDAFASGKTGLAL